MTVLATLFLGLLGLASGFCALAPVVGAAAHYRALRDASDYER